MLIDEVDITLIAGNGGSGLVSFGKKAHSGPNGGNGGKGGDVYVYAEPDITLLNKFSRKKIFSADNGKLGGKNRKSGKSGNDLIIKLPIGTSVIDRETGEILFELTQIGERKLVCTGGKGGRGNYEFRNPRRTTPMFAQPGLPGQKRETKLILKLIADIGLIGLPNAGKSSLLNELTNSKAVTASYPFTTLYPNLGVINNLVIADIPGLIEGASGGKGLGISFLKHIEKVGVIFHCISSESVNPLNDYKTVRKELKNYSVKLSEIPETVLITKSDLVNAKVLDSVKKKLSKYSKVVDHVSIYDWESIDNLKKRLIAFK